jgi:DNA-binding transcriptional ArsR family regulator/SAM-dependent methyltransferase
MAGVAALIERGALVARHSGVSPPPFPTPYFDTWAAALSARAVMAATRLGVIDALAEQPDDAAGLARKLELDERGVDALLGALTALDYVRRRRDGRYRLTRAARRWLAPDSPTAIAALVGEFTYDAWDHIGALERVLQGGEPIGWHEHHPDDPYWERYQRAMHELSAMGADLVARALPLRAPERLLDLAGGCGRYAEALCRRHPGLHATIAELEAPARLGRTRIARAGLADRIDYRAGDLFAGDPGSGYDVVTAHSILHCLTPDRCVELLGRARDAARPGGLVAALDMDRGAGTRIGALGALLFHVIEPGTRTWTAAELTGYMKAAGLTRVRAKTIPRLAGSVLMLAERPTA